MICPVMSNPWKNLLSLDDRSELDPLDLTNLHPSTTTSGSHRPARRVDVGRGGSRSAEAVRRRTEVKVTTYLGSLCGRGKRGET